MMHNIIAREQLTEWRHFEDTIDDLESELQIINDYYECLIECDEVKQHVREYVGDSYHERLLI